MPEARLERTRRAYQEEIGSIRATAGGDWVVGMGASYVPCPNACGRMVADQIRGRAVDVAPCSRCQRLEALRKHLTS